MLPRGEGHGSSQSMQFPLCAWQWNNLTHKYDTIFHAHATWHVPEQVHAANSLPHAPKNGRREDWERGEMGVDSAGVAARHVIINAKLQNVCNTCGLLQKDRKRSAAHLGFAQTSSSPSLSLFP